MNAVNHEPRKTHCRAGCAAQQLVKARAVGGKVGGQATVVLVHLRDKRRTLGVHKTSLMEVQTFVHTRNQQLLLGGDFM